MSKDASSPTKPISALDDYVLLGPSGNFFDTACNYNMGESERFLGDYVSDKRSDVVIATKFSANVTNMQKDKRYNPNSGKLEEIIEKVLWKIWMQV
ncbi:hypothetical protein RhiirA1_468923 [Rhizophagus irregularis]|uniref:NADP-dependent oxidoreductase domain-containing protein n=1 Tax=Rhizophagus irregularis TaxID=588596 RepID=A0A2N0R950_9GLOM|nr:hypothetical protein RhiirA1_468923 [Rhizophagus irregularis]